MKPRALSMSLLALLATPGCLDADDPREVPTCSGADVRESDRPDVPLRRQTAHLDIHSAGFVCAGMAAELERHVGFVAAQFEIDLRPNIPVYLLEDRPEQCPSTAVSCVKAGGIVLTIPRATYHELNHSVACQLRAGNHRPALTEGLAVMFDPDPDTRILDEDDALIEMLESGSSDLRYANAGHFARWLYEREGPLAFADLYRYATDIEGTVDELEEIYAAPLDELEAEYLGDAPHAWVPFRQCADIPHLERDDDGVWRYSALMDCEDESTMGPYVRQPASYLLVREWDIMYQSFTFTVDEQMVLDYDLHGEVDRVLLERCGDAHPSSEDHQEFDHATMFPKDVHGNQSHPDLSPGTWRVDILRRHAAPAPVGVAFWADPDPFP
jgi:hypothetical protein